MSPVMTSIVFAVTMLAGAGLGSFARSRLPGHHLDGDTKDLVKVGVAFLATLAALVLGLIVASAKSSFETKTAEVQQAAGKVLQLDSTLRRIGADAEPARAILRTLVAARVAQFRTVIPDEKSIPAFINAANGMEGLRDSIQRIEPRGERQRAEVAKALHITDEVEEIMSLAVAQSGSSITTPLLVVLMFWFAVITAGWNLFAPPNGTTLAVNILCAMSVASAIFLILEMDRPFGSVIRVSDHPLRAVMSQLGP